MLQALPTQEAKMNHLLRVALSLLLAALATGAAAQNVPSRGGKWEFTLQPQYTHSMSFDSGNGTSGTVDSALGFGFGVGYNLNPHFTLGGDFFWNQANYNATIAPAAGNPNPAYNVNGTLQSSTIRFNATWNFSASDFTPFVTGGIGSTYVDTNIPNGIPQNVCWYDPWYGYYCGSYVPTKTAYYVSYSGGLGLRWEVDRSIFLRAVAIRQWLDVGGSLGQPYTDQYRFDVGFKF
jgi:opacity protein-like surface antigen